ncbi:MAG: acetolactate synthase large subunit [Dehalococcoidia bacterium]|nr:acetolactate synthase large subunit [Dehalococcoidia bacterium]
MNAAQLLVRCLEAEGVKYVFGLPGEEVMHVLDALADSSITFIPTRHEAGAAFMADVYGRLTGRAGVCLATLGPGATNLATGVADANLDRSPLVAITGQTSLDVIHEESHQYIDLSTMFRPITKWSVQVERAETVPEVVRKAFRVAEMERPGAAYISLPENVAAMEVAGSPMRPTPIEYALPRSEDVLRASSLIAQARSPIIIAGNGVLRRNASRELQVLAEAIHVPVAETFMGKGALDYRHHLSLMPVGLQARDWIMCGLDRADLVIAVGYDMVEYAPRFWNPNQDKAIIHLDSCPAEVQDHYVPQVEIVADLREGLLALAGACHGINPFPYHTALRDMIRKELADCQSDDSFPVKPQRLVADLREALGDEDILVSDVGAHKLWLARMYPTACPNTILISNGFAAMGIAVPGAIAAKLVNPNRKVVAVAGDGSFLMTASELETAKRIGTPFVTVVWVDGAYGLIEWKQQNAFGRSFGVSFGNPDFVTYAQAFGLPGFRVERASDFLPTLRRALDLPEPSVIEVAVDYSENLRLTERLGRLTCTI